MSVRSRMRKRRHRRQRRRGRRRERRKERRQERRDRRKGISAEERASRDAANAERKAERKSDKQEAKTETLRDRAMDFDRALKVDASAGRAFDSEAEARKQAQVQQSLMVQAEAQQQQAREQQQGVLDLLMAQSRGEGPSVAQQQLQAGMERGQSQAAALAASQRGNPFLAARQAQQQQAALAAQTNQQAAALRAQEMLAARQQAGALASGMRAGDADSRGFFGDRQMGFLGFGSNERAQGTNAILANRNLTQGFAAQGLQQQQLDNQQRQTRAGAVLGTIATAAPVFAALASDKRGKTRRKVDPKAVRSIFDKLAPHTFRYLGEDTDRVGIMAQDLEKTRHGRALVHDTPTGKVVDVPQATGAVLAGVADLSARIKRLEAEARRKKSA